MPLFKLIIAFFLSFVQFFSPFFAMLNGGIDSFYDKWSENDTYTADYAIELKKNPDKDFVVLNFADIQLSGLDVYNEKADIAAKTIDKAIKATNPDLITLTGDNGSGKMAYIEMIKVIDSYGIPWAPVMGNHDGENGKRVDEAWCGWQLENAENCLFKFGPEGMGVGNYVINITENGRIIHTLYMMDTHSSTDKECGGYDHLWDNQLKWYEWAVKGTNAIAGTNVESSIFFHIPCIQYRDAWKAVYDDEAKQFKQEYYSNGNFGKNDEGICSPEYDSGFFALVKSLGSTKNMVAGHDHSNDSSILYDGIRLSYGLKCGKGSYTFDGKNGGSTLTIGSDGHADFAHYYVDIDTLD